MYLHHFIVVFTAQIQSMTSDSDLSYDLSRLEIQWNLYKADTIGAKKSVRFIEIFSKIVWPQNKAIRSSSYCPSFRGLRFIGVRFIEIPL